MGVDQSKEEFGFSKAELKVLLKNFNELDVDGSGFLEPNELFDVPELKDNPIVQRIVNVFDENNDGCISFYEFVNGLTSLASKSEPIEKFKFVFKIYDFNGDGVISNGDLFNMIKLMVKNSLGDIHVQQLVDRTMQAADKDKDGVLSLEEFIIYVNNSNIEQMFSMSILDTLQ